MACRAASAASAVLNTTTARFFIDGIQNDSTSPADAYTQSPHKHTCLRGDGFRLGDPTKHTIHTFFRKYRLVIQCTLPMLLDPSARCGRNLSAPKHSLIRT